VRLLLVGYFGAGNLGDELILKAAAGFLLERFPKAKLLYISRGQVDPPHPSLRPLHFLDLGRIAYWAAKATAAIFPGGSVLQNRTSLRSLFYYRTVAGLLRRFGTPYFMLGQGIGPLVGRVAQGYAREVLSGAEWISARDQEAFIEMANLLGPNRKLHLGADTALLTPPQEPAQVEREQARRLVVVPRAWLDLEGLAGALGRIERAQFEEAVVAYFEPGEEELAARVAELISPLTSGIRVVAPSVDHPTMPFLGSSLVISCRYHGVLLSALAGVPAIALGRDPKLIALSGSLALPLAERPEQLPQLIEPILEEGRGGKLQAALHRLRQRAQVAWEELARRLSAVAG